jgi:diguanylate cyclase (GGDEF)-like protein
VSSELFWLATPESLGGSRETLGPGNRGGEREVNRAMSSDPAFEEAAGEPTASPIEALWATSRDTLLEQVRVLDDVALAGLQGTLTAPARLDAEECARALAGSLGSFGLTDAARLAGDAEWLLQGTRPLSANDFLRLSEVVVRVELELGRGPKLSTGTPPGGATPVLIVEADADLGRRLAEEATAAGLRPTVADSVPAAYELIGEDRPTLVVLDLDHADGGPALLESLCLAAEPVPTLALTSPAGKLDRAEVARLGALGYLEKPIPAKAVVDVVRRTLARRHDEATVLAVADDQATLNDLRGLFEPRGWHLNPLTSPDRFWQSLEVLRPELLVLDVDPHGPQLCRMVRNDPTWQRLPIICITSPNLEQRREIYRAGADDVVVKPAEDDELLERVGNRLERSRLQHGQGNEDPQTGLPAWPHFETELHRQLVLARRYGQSLVLAVLAVDEQDEIEARYGNRAGQLVRAALGRVLRRSFRLEDAVGCRGDRHLLASLYGANMTGVQPRMNRVLASFTDIQVTFEDETIQATASAGLSTFPADGTRVGALYDTAAAALEQAQAMGGNRLQTTGEKPMRGETVEVLLLDDDDALAPLLLHALRTRGYSCGRLRDGADAAEQLLAADGMRARVLLLDIDLPGLDGLSLLRALASQHALDKMRAIVVSLRSNESEVLQALDLGAYDYMTKPVSIPELMHRVRRAMESLTR